MFLPMFCRVTTDHVAEHFQHTLVTEDDDRPVLMGTHRWELEDGNTPHPKGQEEWLIGEAAFAAAVYAAPAALPQDAASAAEHSDCYGDEEGWTVYSHCGQYPEEAPHEDAHSEEDDDEDVTEQEQQTYFGDRFASTYENLRREC